MWVAMALHREEAMRARPDAGDPTQLKRDLKKVLKDMVDAGKLGSKNEENSGKWIQWVWALG
jgi:3-hydroxyacyl-CoA dehydrogenase